MAKTVRRGAIVTISAPADYGKIEYHAFSDDRTGWLVIDPESFVGVGPQRGRTARKFVINSLDRYILYIPHPLLG